MSKKVIESRKLTKEESYPHTRFNKGCLECCQKRIADLESEVEEQRGWLDKEEVKANIQRTKEGELRNLLKEKAEEITKLFTRLDALVTKGEAEYYPAHKALKKKIEGLEIDIKDYLDANLEYGKSNADLQALIEKIQEAARVVPFKTIASLLENTGHDVYARDIRTFFEQVCAEGEESEVAP